MSLKNKAWGINVVGTNGTNGINDIEFGATQEEQPAIRIGNTIATEDTIGGNSAFDSIDKISDYLYQITYDKLDNEYAKKYFEENYKPVYGGCSAVRNGNWYGRNFDWFYDDRVEFVVRTTHKNNRYASIGVGGTDGLVKSVVESGEYTVLYKVLPFSIKDGINEKGLICNTNVVPTQKGKTIGTIPTEEKKDEVCDLAIVRYILDNYATASEAVNDLQKHVSIYNAKSLDDIGYDIHCMIADKDETYLIEFINNSIVVTNMTQNSNSILAGKPYMTNFFLSDIILNDDGTVYTPSTQTETQNAIDTNNITSLGDGLERYNIIVSEYENAGEKAGMINLMTNLLRYTNTYKEDTTHPWYTEVVGVNGLTVVSTPEKFDPIMKKMRELYAKRSRTEGIATWQTTHTSIYDIENQKLFLYSQEEDKEYAFDLFENVSMEKFKNLLIKVQELEARIEELEK